MKKSKTYTKQQITKNRIFTAVSALVVIGVIAGVLALFLWRTPYKRGYIEQGPVAPSEQTEYLTGRDTYDFSAAVPEAPAVDDRYFFDALFVGGSRVGGLHLTNKTLPLATILYSDYASVERGINAPFYSGDTGATVTLSGQLSFSYEKIYLQFGLNELGWQNKPSFKTSYGSLVDAVLERAPSSAIYIVSILPVSATKSASSEWLTNENIALYNSYLRALALEKGVFYLDLASAVIDPTGALDETLSTNGIYLNAAGYGVWAEYCKTHTVPEYVYK